MLTSRFIYTTIAILLFTLLSYGVYSHRQPTVEQVGNPVVETASIESNPLHDGKYILVHLNTNTLELKDGTTTLESMSLVSQGKPGSYYETIGGSYMSDYKEPNHFSSIGHVYMPHSVHIFGNYFIHGIPYYPDGTEVSSTYSGGCIRLSNADATKVYEFVTRGMPIIITKDGEYDFSPTATTTPTMMSTEMTTQMVAVISLEFLTQDNTIADTDGVSLTTRRTLLPRMLSGDMNVNTLFSKTLGEKTFTDYMNQKARTIGLTNTVFLGVRAQAVTSPEDKQRFENYIATYKSYLTKLPIMSASPLVYR